MAEILSVSPTPNPNAMKFTVDRTFDEMFNVTSKDGAGSNEFAAAVFDSGLAAAVFGSADFVTITRVEGADWTAIEAVVRKAASTHL